MMEDKKVSVIMPVYNCEKFLERAVQSVINQDYKNLELIIVDDGSKDNSFGVCSVLCKNDPRIKLYHKENGGVSSARNYGLKHAQGEFVCFIDADDSYEWNYISTMLKEIKDFDCVICGYNLITQNSTTHITAEKKVFRKKEKVSNILEYIEKGVFNSCCNKLYKREKIEKSFFDGQEIGEDLMFNLDYFINCEKVIFIPDCLYNYDRRNEQSAMKTKTQSKETFDRFWSNITSAVDLLYGNNIDNAVNNMYFKSLFAFLFSYAYRRSISFKEFKKLFNYYRNNDIVLQRIKGTKKLALKKHRRLFNILFFLFKAKLSLIFFILAKIYKY